MATTVSIAAAANETTQSLEILAPGPVKHAARREEEQPLDHRMVPHVQEGATDSQGRHPFVTVR